MKTSVRTLLSLCLTVVLAIIAVMACSNDPDPTPSPEPPKPEPEVRPALLASIEDSLRAYYYWYDEIPTTASLDYDAETEDFFNSLLAADDGKQGYHYSYIEEKNSTRTRGYIDEAYSYGFDFMALSLDQNGDGLVDSYYAFVEYVLDGTPAAEAGLQRGDWIVKIDGKNITDYTVLYGDDAHEFTLGIFTREYDAAGTLTGGYFDLKPSTELAPNPISMSTARAVEDYPVFKDTIVTSDGGKKVGYLAYNHFSRGVDDEADTDYDDQLRGLSRKFKTAGVEEFVLDLRYNNGGFLTCALLLSTMLAPEAAIGQEACSLVYNDKMSLKYDYSYNFMTQYLNQSPENPTGPKGENLNLPRLYVLTSGMTASASEMVINCLRPYYTVTLIGSQTEGKNVGSMPYDTSDGKWIMHPIVSRISNSAGFSDYSDGFPPDYELYEFYELQGGGAFPLDSRDIYPLGDPKERMFAAALTHIDTGSITRATTTRTLVPPSGRYKVIQNVSALRKPTNGVILDRNRGINH